MEGHRIKANPFQTKFDKFFDQTRIENQNIVFDCDQERERLRKLEMKLLKAKMKLEAAQKEKEALLSLLPKSEVQVQKELDKMRRRRGEKAWIENYIQRSQRVIEFMQKQTPKTMRIYL